MNDPTEDAQSAADRLLKLFNHPKMARMIRINCPHCQQELHREWREEILYPIRCDYCSGLVAMVEESSGYVVISKACPFCRSSVVTPEKFNEFGRWCVHCDDCGCDGPERDSELEAIAAWNKRGT